MYRIPVSLSRPSHGWAPTNIAASTMHVHGCSNPMSRSSVYIGTHLDLALQRQRFLSRKHIHGSYKDIANALR